MTLATFKFLRAGYGSLPRNLSSRNTPGNFAQTRRKLVNNAIQDYLKSLNAMTRSIVLETETVEKENHCNWKKLDTASKEDLVNDHFMPADVRMQYCYEQERTASSCSFNSSWSMCSGDLVENRPMQSSDWANERQQISKNAKDLNDRSSMVSHFFYSCYNQNLLKCFFYNKLTIN